MPQGHTRRLPSRKAAFVYRLDLAILKISADYQGLSSGEQAPDASFDMSSHLIQGGSILARQMLSNDTGGLDIH
jgi:hypothetical protein